MRDGSAGIQLAKTFRKSKLEERLVFAAFDQSLSTALVYRARTRRSRLAVLLSAPHRSRHLLPSGIASTRGRLSQQRGPHNSGLWQQPSSSDRGTRCVSEPVSPHVSGRVVDRLVVNGRQEGQPEEGQQGGELRRVSPHTGFVWSDCRPLFFSIRRRRTRNTTTRQLTASRTSDGRYGVSRESVCSAFRTDLSVAQRQAQRREERLKVHIDHRRSNVISSRTDACRRPAMA